jgi:hypothetical protein
MSGFTKVPREIEDLKAAMVYLFLARKASHQDGHKGLPAGHVRASLSYIKRGLSSYNYKTSITSIRRALEYLAQISAVIPVQQASERKKDGSIYLIRSYVEDAAPQKTQLGTPNGKEGIKKVYIATLDSYLDSYLDTDPIGDTKVSPLSASADVFTPAGFLAGHEEEILRLWNDGQPDQWVAHREISGKARTNLKARFKNKKQAEAWMTGYRWLMARKDSAAPIYSRDNQWRPNLEWLARKDKLQERIDQLGGMQDAREATTYPRYHWKNVEAQRQREEAAQRRGSSRPQS